MLPTSKEPLNVLKDDRGIYIGKKVEEKGGELFIGKCLERDYFGEPVFLDSLSPHVVFICGARGSGKSYTLGIIAEEIVEVNPNIAAIIVDPIGIYWSMKFPNRDPRELEELGKWGLEPKGIKNVRVLIPYGAKNDVPKGTFDGTFTIKVKELTVDDWCLTFGIDRFSPVGLLLEKAIEKAKEKGDFGLDDLIKIIEGDKEFLDKKRGYPTSTRRALISRLEAAKGWGILSRDGTPLSEIAKKGWITVLDTSFLEENVSALVIGILARNLLRARKIVTRRIAMKQYELDPEFFEIDIPPVWLFIDEAHTLVPGGNVKTPASDPLIEYVKQGRRPGCSLVFATQQPSAINTKILSQLDIIFVHKLVFDDDIKAVFKRMPTLVPREYMGSFIKTLPIGYALVGDRAEQTSRAFVIKMRPRMSQHEGREMKTVEMEIFDPEQIKKAVLELCWKRLKRKGSLSLAEIDEMVNNFNKKYGINLDPLEVADYLKNKGGEKKGTDIVYEERETKKVVELSSEKEIKKWADRVREKKFFGRSEKIEKIEPKYVKAWIVDGEVKEGESKYPIRLLIDSYGFIYFKSKNGWERKEIGKRKEDNNVIEPEFQFDGQIAESVVDVMEDGGKDIKKIMKKLKVEGKIDEIAIKMWRVYLKKDRVRILERV